MLCKDRLHLHCLPVYQCAESTVTKKKKIWYGSFFSKFLVKKNINILLMPDCQLSLWSAAWEIFKMSSGLEQCEGEYMMSFIFGWTLYLVYITWSFIPLEHVALALTGRRGFMTGYICFPLWAAVEFCVV